MTAKPMQKSVPRGFRTALQAIAEVAKENLPAGFGYELGGMAREEASTSGSTTGIIFVRVATHAGRGESLAGSVASEAPAVATDAGRGATDAGSVATEAGFGASLAGSVASEAPAVATEAPTVATEGANFHISQLARAIFLKF